jgi:hypothetical protein
MKVETRLHLREHRDRQLGALADVLEARETYRAVLR